MNYHLIVTDQCNLNCSYCRGRVGIEDEGPLDALSLDGDVPVDFTCDVKDLAAFLARDSRPSVTFYGGEPLLRSDLVTTIMDQIPGVTYLLHTNGTLLDRLPVETLQHLQTISVSIDGPETLTDRNRGTGTYRRIMRNIHSILAKGFQGELIARMTVPPGTDIRHAVRYLAENPDHSFSSIHWQLDADFSRGSDQFPFWVENVYNPGIRALIQDWVEQIGVTGRVPRWYPFVDPLKDMIEGRKSLLRCGCGHESYGILTHGAIVPCPLFVGMKEHYLGHIAYSHPGDLRRYTVGGRCSGCLIRDFCGGRCLYSSIMGFASEEQKDSICHTVQNLYNGLKDALPRMQKYLEEGTIRYEDLDHPRFEGCEIIP